MNKYRIKKVQVDKDTTYYYPQERYFFFWDTLGREIRSKTDYPYFRQWSPYECNTYEDALKVIQDYKEEKIYPKVEYLKVAAPIEKTKSFSELLLPRKTNG
jgi:hypothetical protein